MCIFKWLKRAKLKTQLANMEKELEDLIIARDYYRTSARQVKETLRVLERLSHNDECAYYAYVTNKDGWEKNCQILLIKATNSDYRAKLLQSEIEEIIITLKK